LPERLPAACAEVEPPDPVTVAPPEDEAAPDVADPVPVADSAAGTFVPAPAPGSVVPAPEVVRPPLLNGPALAAFSVVGASTLGPQPAPTSTSRTAVAMRCRFFIAEILPLCMG